MFAFIAFAAILIILFLINYRLDCLFDLINILLQIQKENKK